LSKDLRKYSRDTNIRLGVGAVLLLLIVGGGLIWAIYGAGAGGMALTCLFAGVMTVLLIIGVFFAIDWILGRARPK
jgi:hypothetical protein